MLAGFEEEDEVEAEAEGAEGECTALGWATPGLVVMGDAVVMVPFLYGALVGTAAIFVLETLDTDAGAVPDEAFAVVVAVAVAGILDCEADTASAINAGPGIV